MNRSLRIRLFVSCLAVCCAASAGAQPPQSPRDASPDTLREAADRSHMLIGAAVRPAQLSEPAYAATLAREFNMLEPEDALKWEALRPDPQSFDFQQADQVVDFAARHNMKVRGHTLVWHKQLPQWLSQSQQSRLSPRAQRTSLGPLRFKMLGAASAEKSADTIAEPAPADATYTPAQLSHLLETHIKTVVAHYRGKVFAWDVANEAFDEGKNTGKLRSTLWYDQPGIGFAGQGYAYLAQCFRWAREADPQALLFYNEAEAEEINPKSDAIYAMARAFKRDGVPIEGIGFQMHINNLRANIASISENIARFTALGLQVHITEMDVALPVDANGNASAEDLNRQAEIYRQIAATCLSHPGCTAIQTWGFTDKYSWIGSHSKHTQGAALPFDRTYHPKPAYDTLRTALSQPR